MVSECRFLFRTLIIHHEIENENHEFKAFTSKRLF